MTSHQPDSATLHGSGGTTSPGWLHPSFDAAFKEYEFRLGNRRITGPCGSLHRDNAAMNLGNTSFWSQHDLRWSECRKCGIVLHVWTRAESEVQPKYRWEEWCVIKGLERQRDADPGWGYTTGETVNIFCEQARLAGTRAHSSAMSPVYCNVLSFEGEATEDVLPLQLPCKDGLPLHGGCSQTDPRPATGPADRSLV